MRAPDRSLVHAIPPTPTLLQPRAPGPHPKLRPAFAGSVFLRNFRRTQAPRLWRPRALKPRATGETYRDRAPKRGPKSDALVLRPCESSSIFLPRSDQESRRHLLVRPPAINDRRLSGVDISL